jgi:hypothetical protein
MKKILTMAVSLLLILAVSNAHAAMGDLSWDVAGGVGIPLSSGYDLGFGGEGTAELNIAPSLNATGSLGFYTFNVTGSTSAYSASSAAVPILVGLKYGLGPVPGLKPYILGQVGFADFINSITESGISLSGSSFYPEVAGGAGLGFDLGPASTIGIFVQVKIAVVLGNGGTFTYLPILGGVSF